MAKSNDKKNRTQGITKSGNTELPDPLNSYNSPLGNLNNQSNEAIQKKIKQNKLF